MSKAYELANHLEKLNINNMYNNDFYWTWDKTDDEIDAIFTVADALRDLRERNSEYFYETRYGLDPNRKTLLFISSFAEAGKPLAEAAVVDGDEEESRENIRMQEKSQEILLDWFRQLLRDEEGLQIIYRPHPAEAKNPEFLKRAREIRDFHVIQQESIRNWIMNCDILCNWQSTAMIELYAAKKKSLILRPIPIPFKRAMPIFDEGHFPAVLQHRGTAGV